MRVVVAVSDDPCAGWRVVNDVTMQMHLAVIRAVDAYLIANRAAQENLGHRWRFATDERKITDEQVAPLDASLDAFLAQLAKDGYEIRSES